jgi:hypothetical protein
MKLAAYLIAAGLATAAGGAQAAASFRCLDKSGKTTYMERPCEVFGLKYDKTIKDLPKGDGTQTPLGNLQSFPTEKSLPPQMRKPKYMVGMMCDGQQIRCYPRDEVQCGDRRVTCDSD